MFKCASVFILFFVLSSPQVYGDEYSFQVDLGYQDADSDITESEIKSLSLSYFLQPVSDENGPISETAFIEKASSVSLNYGRVDSTTNQMFSDATIVALVVLPDITFVKDENLNLAIAYIFENDWILSGSVGLSDSEENTAFRNTSEDGYSTSIAIGKYLSPSTTVSVGYSYSEQDSSTSLEDVVFTGAATVQLVTSLELADLSSLGNDFNGSAVQFTPASTEQKQDIFSLSAKHLQSFNEMYWGLDAQVNWIDIETSLPGTTFSFDTDAWSADLGITLYPRRDIGISLNYGYFDADTSSTDTYSLGLNWFINSKFALSANYGHTNQDFSLLDQDLFGISLTGRF